MQWPDWLRRETNRRADDEKREAPSPLEPPSKPVGSWEASLNKTDWQHYTSPQTITVSVITTATAIALIRLWKTYLRRIPTVDHLKPALFRRRNLYGYVTRVGDADNFHLFHTPGGRLLGWGWLPWRRLAESKNLKNRTIHVRIAGIDAPELAHFGKQAQPHSQEALDWLKSAVLHQYVRAYPYRRDQYGRVVCSVYKRRWLLFKSDVGLNMLKCGLATVYEAKQGSEFGGKEQQYRAAEARAKEKQRGIWQAPGLVDRMLGKKSTFESPREYKTRVAGEDDTAKIRNTTT